jgi:hypothetical protein
VGLLNGDGKEELDLKKRSGLCGKMSLYLYDLCQVFIQRERERERERKRARWRLGRDDRGKGYMDSVYVSTP